MLDKMVSQNIIEPVGNEVSAWCHPMVVTPKKSGEVRITVDLSKLNQQVLRPAHLFPSPRSTMMQVSQSSKYFSMLDAMWGYWQLPLGATSQLLTTFITPRGRYKFLRGPMGFVSTGDEFCKRGDTVLKDIERCTKVMDDVLVWDATFEEHLQRVHLILERFRQHRISINKKKFIFASSIVSFCGYNISHDSVQADPAKVRTGCRIPRAHKYH